MHNLLINWYLLYHGRHGVGNFGAPAPLALSFNWRFPLYKPDRLGRKQLSAHGPSKRHTDQQVLESRRNDQIDAWWLCPVKCPLSVPVLAVIEGGKRYNKEQCLWYFGICSVTSLCPGVSLHLYVQAGAMSAGRLVRPWESESKRFIVIGATVWEQPLVWVEYVETSWLLWFP